MRFVPHGFDPGPSRGPVLLCRENVDSEHAVSSGFVRRMAAVLTPMLLVPLAAVVLMRVLWPRPPTSETRAVAPSRPQLDAPLEDRTPEVRGRILDAEGNPVQGATIRLVSASRPYKVSREATSQGGGVFSFAHVVIGPLRVVADHGADGFATSAELRAAEGRTTDVTLVLSVAGDVRGTVVDGEQHPVAGAAISVEGVPGSLPGATSDEAGAFRLPLVPAEATALVAVARGYKSASVALANREGRAEVVVRIQLVAAPPVDGDVSGTDGEPVRAEVVACAGEPFEVRAASAEDGTFLLPASAIGCQAVADQAGYGSSEPALVVDGRRTRLRLKTGGSIEGEVVDDRGSGVPSFTVGIESYSSPRRKSVDKGGGRRFDDPGGAFRWDKLAPGSYVLTASAPGKPPTRSGAIEVVGGTATRGVRIVLPRGGSVTGRVYDEGRAPLAGVDVAFDSVSSVVDGAAATKTDESGRYRLDSAPAGLLTLRVQRAGFRARLVSGLRVGSGATITEDVALVAVDGGGGLELTGIGANLKLTDDGIEMAGVGAGDPAGLAGLQAGDRILGIDGESCDGMSVADAVQRLRGETGTSVGVFVERPKTRETLDVMIVRAPIVR